MLGKFREPPLCVYPRIHDKREQHIHDHARRYHKRPGPYGFTVEVGWPWLARLHGPFSLAPFLFAPFEPGHHLVVHSTHLHVPAQRHPAYHILGFAPPEAEHRRRQTDGEALHLDAYGFRCHEVAELMDKNEDAKYNNRRKNRHAVFDIPLVERPQPPTGSIRLT